MNKLVKIAWVSVIVSLSFGLISSNAQDTDNDNLPESWVNPPPDKNAPFSEHTFVKSKWAPLVSMGEDGQLVYKPYSEKGDLVLDWSNCGYKRSEVPIPDVSVVETLQPLSENSSPFENMSYPKGPDNLEQIQSALDRVGDRKPDVNGFKGAVLLEKGNYFIDG
ncbi:MAG: hypothetical protein R3182_09965, partial [Draconibacterium sp.]|nr:hypothetical protein [Draconibacterium sp.]